MAKKARRVKGEGSIRERKGGLFEGRVVMPDGTRKSVYAKSKRELVEKMKGEGRQPPPPLAASTLPPASKKDFPAAVADWIADKRARGNAAKTVDRVENVVKSYLLPAFTDTDLSSINDASLKEYLLRLVKENVSDWERWRIFNCLKELCKYHKHPAFIDFKAPRQPQGRFRALTRDEVSRLLAAAEGDRYEALIHLALDTGMRPGELFALEKRHVYPDTGEVLVCQSQEVTGGKRRIKGTKTKGSVRRLPVTEGTMDRLGPHLIPPGVQLFRNRKGTTISPATFRESTWVPMLARAGIGEVRFYDLRHTAATLWLLAGHSVAMVSQRLGHTDATMVLKVYAHFIPTHQRLMLPVIADILGGRIRGTPGGVVGVNHD